MNELSITVSQDDEQTRVEGSVEEQASFGRLTFRCGNICLTEGLDGFSDCIRLGPLVSGYPLAEWIAWNWWRLVGEPKPLRTTYSWNFAHSLTTVGSGYVWPNITIFSDRERTVLIAKPTHLQGFAAFRFTTDWAVVLPTRQFESAVDRFMAQIQGQLRDQAVALTNCDRLWDEVQVERADPEMAIRRRLEALLGLDPDEGWTDLVEHLLADARCLGQDAALEVAADCRPGRRIPNADDFSTIAKMFGSESRPVDRVQLADVELPPR